MNTKITDAAFAAIKHSIQQARIPGNDWRRELALIENTVDEALEAAQPHMQPSVVGDSRAQFEAWAKDFGLDDSRSTFDQDGYKQTPTKFAWAAWQAALAATGAQQVGESPEWREELVREAYNRGLMEGLNSPRPQQVGEVQGDALLALAGEWRRDSKERFKRNEFSVVAESLDACACELESALAARQPVRNEGTSEADFVADGADLNCPACAGSWHIEDARQPVGWQPMESAPTDGTVVLGLLEGSDIPQSIRFRDGWEIAWDGYRIPAHDGPLRWAPLYAATPAQQPAQVYLDGLDRALGEAIDQRDRYHEMADDLAGHIAAITGVDIGEHSSANCPWQNAIEAAEEYKPAQAVDLGQYVPTEKSVPARYAEDDSDAQYNSGWNDCRGAMLSLIDQRDAAPGLK